MQNEHIYPLKLVPVPREIVWGGDLLKRKYGKSTPFAKLAESWELTVRSDNVSSIANGPCAGTTLADYIEKYGKAVVGDRWSGERFPLLIKFIDARDKLSVQVHPGDEYALKKHGEYGKTEAWYIVEAEPGAKIVWGMKQGCGSAELREAAEKGDIASVLNYTEVRSGQLYFIPSGLIHAIGAGILIAEIQQNSDITYRVYDYNRPDDTGRLRPLHLEDAYASVKALTPVDIEALRYKQGKSGNFAVNCEYFSIEIFDRETVSCVDESSFACVQCVEGGGKIIFDGREYPITAGDSYFLPAGAGGFAISDGVKALVSRYKER